MQKWFVKIEWLVGGISVLLGILLQTLLIRQGVWVPGAIMLVVTGSMSCVIAWKDQKGFAYSPLGENLMVVFRRTLLFLNIMLALLVAFTLLGALG